MTIVKAGSQYDARRLLHQFCIIVNTNYIRIQVTLTAVVMLRIEQISIRRKITQAMQFDATVALFLFPVNPPQLFFISAIYHYYSLTMRPFTVCVWSTAPCCEL